jgi:psp operon transcriptional activator
VAESAQAVEGRDAAAPRQVGGINHRDTPFDFKREVQDFEVALIKQALEKAQFNQKKAAEQLGLTYHQLRGYLRKYEMLG